MTMNRKGLRRVRTSQAPTFRRIELNLPQAPVEQTLPKTLSFLIDSRFTREQVNRIRDMITLDFSRWNTHHEERDQGIVTTFESCVGKYATTLLEPIWFDGRLANGRVAADLVVDTLTRMFVANGFNRAPAARIHYRTPIRGTDFAVIANRNSNPDRTSPDTTSLTVAINPLAINRTGISTTLLSGSLFYAWMLRMGYRTPLPVSFLADSRSFHVFDA